MRFMGVCSTVKYIHYEYFTHVVKICCFYVKCVLDCTLIGGTLEIYTLTSIIFVSSIIIR